MAKNFRPTGQERFNFIAALIAYVIHNDYSTIEEVAAHFEVSEEYVRDAITTMVNTASDRPGMEETYYMYDEDELDDGVIHLIQTDGFAEVPKLSVRQTSAIAAGLNYLSSFPEFTNQDEIAELLEILSKGSATDSAHLIEYKPGTVDADAAVIRRAMLHGHRISCEYKNQRGETSLRQIDPIRLDPRGELWYLKGYCLKNKELRNFRLDHMRGATELEVAICDEARSIGDIVDEEYTASDTDIEVIVEVEPEAYSLISDFAADVIGSDSKSGLTRASIKVGYLPTLGRVINHYGGAARVISPESARRAVRNYALTALGRPVDDQLNED
ncbi:MAG: helix-turn-helix transcriptional regulator [Micrococcales bacterium]